MTNSGHEQFRSVNFAAPRGFLDRFNKDIKETLFPDDPFKKIKEETTSWSRTKAGLKYFVPIFEWLPLYNLSLFKYDLLAGITIASLAIPQGISYAKLANIPPIIGLYSSFVPPLIYAVFGSSKHLAVGTVAASSLLIASTLGEKVSHTTNPKLYLDLVFTAAFVSGVVQAAMGILRLGILVDFLSHSTIIGFMGGTATIICLQQLKGIFGLKHFTSNTDVVSVLKSVFKHRKEWRWECILVGVIFLTFLQLTRFVRQKKPKLFWVSAIGPIIVVITGCLFAYFIDAEKYGIQTVGPLKKGLNPISIQRLNFDTKYISAPIKAGFITAMIALAEGIAIGRSFAIKNNLQIDGNKEMIAFGVMNLVGSFTSCYLTTGPFSKTAVNYNAGCRTAMSNVVMAILMMLTLLFLAPLFSYTPLVALSAIIMSAMLSLIDYEKAYHFYKIDKFDFLIYIVGFIGVAFLSMDTGLCLSIGLALIRSLIYIARPATCKLGNVPNSNLFRDVEQYPNATGIPGFLILQLGSPIYFANCNYIRERILRWLRDEESRENVVEQVLLDLGGVSVIDVAGVEILEEVVKILEGKKIKVALINPRIDVLEKLIVMKFVDKFGKENIFFSVEDAIETIKFTLKESV